VIHPDLVVLLGATAAQSVLGPSVVTIHPSAILRLKEPDRRRELDALVRDLRVAAAHVAPVRRPDGRARGGT
jgi:uracil-DNA glycosylase